MLARRTLFHAVTVAAGLLLLATVVAGARGAGPAPPLGALLDPATGAWAAARHVNHPRKASARVAGLSGPVQVLYDKRGVPHIFAKTQDDAIRALGYVVARDRLFQLDLQTHAAEGRLTELAGARALPVDREMRELGLPTLARERFRAIAPTSEAGRALSAFADGVNAYIDGLSRSEIPIEYRLLGSKPARWRPENSLDLSARMAWTLSFGRAELERDATEALVGKAAADALFPVAAPIQEPMVPNGSRAPRFDDSPIPPPGAMDTARLGRAAAVMAARDLIAPSARDESGDALGSNAWVVAPGRTHSGHALLAGDPHLNLTLPSIWYETHLVVPGALDVYGVTIPGLPSVVLGFNRDVAWSFTNLDADFVDAFNETVDDTLRPTKYRVDGRWRPIERRPEQYLTASGKTVSAETTLFTHRGPLIRARGRWISLRWTVSDKSDELTAALTAQRAKTTQEFLSAMSSWGVPAQNMVVADRAGTIAARSTGHFPIRGDNRGDRLRDGGSSASDWTGTLPVARYPTSVNPAQGFLATANQQPVDPRVDPTYLGASWVDPWRAMRINELLRDDSAVTPDAMRRFQVDPGSPRADLFVPAFIEAARSETENGRASPALVRAADLLAQWDRRYTFENRRAGLFERAMRNLNELTWDELIPPATATDSEPHRVATPSNAVLAKLLRDPNSAWWDDRRTKSVRESRDEILANALEAAFITLVRLNGDPDGPYWVWDSYRKANIYHLLRLGGFSALGIPMQGGTGTLNPSSGEGTHGSSWRMVVELGPEVRGWGIYPGGQSGNPASGHYADRLVKWDLGILDTLRFPKTPESLAAPTATLLLEPK